jgi:hypothetical protein
MSEEQNLESDGAIVAIVKWSHLAIAALTVIVGVSGTWFVNEYRVSRAEEKLISHDSLITNIKRAQYEEMIEQTKLLMTIEHNVRMLCREKNQQYETMR